ncbi:MAG: HAMP domain-containing protein [Rhizobiales bacterium]|nr:HAMP domain-containing protein [Hyphomicrobiales bacterium]MBI3672402.1 HAMP domain-containing protein [Hyphomicrobiales bacterium]
MYRLYSRFNRFLERHLPAGLYQRALIILIAPMVLLQSIMTGVILDRHWDNVTRVLARALARDIGLLIDIYEASNRSEASRRDVEKFANNRLKLGLTITNGDLPPPVRGPLFSLVNRRLTAYLNNDADRPFWIDSVSQPGLVDIRIEAEKGLIFRVLTPEERTYATNTDVLLIWLVLSSFTLLGIAVVFLRKQIAPILELAEAAKSFGTGRDLAEFHPRGAAEVREAGEAFLDMRDRIARQVEQRTAMLAGVSHDLRTILTRFKLELAFLGDSPKVEPLKEDVAEMQRMLEAYMAFVRGDGGETAEEVILAEPIAAAARLAERRPGQIDVAMADGLRARVKPNAFRRLLGNLIGNAARHGKHVKVAAAIADRMLTVTVDDDGPGIPAEQRADAFRPFVRLDNARNLDESGAGLGLAIALDIARAHGGDLRLEDSGMGGLRAVVQIPL